MRSIKRLWLTVIQLLKSWYSADRIRISPTTGRLLQLRTGDTIVLQDELFRVVRRSVCTSRNGHEVVCQLDAETHIAELHIIRNTSHGATVTALLTTNDAAVEVFDDDICMMPPRQSANAGC